MPRLTSLIAVTLLVALTACDRSQPVVLGEPTPLTLPDGAATGPRLSERPDGGLALSWMATSEEGAVLRFASIADGQLAGIRDVVTDKRMFANWADRPSVLQVEGEHWLAHWLSISWRLPERSRLARTDAAFLSSEEKSRHSTGAMIALAVLLALIVVSLSIGIRNARRNRSRQASGNGWLSGSLLALFAGAGLLALGYPTETALLPLIAAGLGFTAVFFDIVLAARRAATVAPAPAPPVPLVEVEWQKQLGWLLAFTATASLLGLSPGLPVLTGLYLRFIMRLSAWRALLIGVLMFTLFELVQGQIMGLSIFRGLLLAGI